MASASSGASITLGELARRLGGEVVGDADRRLTGVRTLDLAGPEDLSFVTQASYLEEAARSQAGALLVGADVHLAGRSLLRVKNASLALVDVIRHFHPPRKTAPGVHPTAIVGDGCRIDASVAVGPYAVVGDGVAIGAGCVIGAHAVVGRCSKLGDGVVLYPHVVLYDDTELGDRVTIHAGVVLGADGFGYVTHQGEHVKVPQVGRVVVECDVEIGALAAVDRALLGDTRIGQGTKIDNLVQVGHNVRIGRGCIVCGQAGLAGSARLQDYVVVGGQSGVMGHHEIPAGTQIAGKSMAMEQSGGGQIAGIPAVDIRKWRRQTVYISRLGEMARRLRALEKRLDRIEPDRKEPDRMEPSDEIP